MSLNIDPRDTAVDAAATPSAETILWLHAAFCEVGLPIRAPRAAWQRDAGGVAIHIEPGATGHPLPGGPLLRLALLHICDQAFRTNSAVVELGGSDVVLAVRLGVEAKARELAEQVERLLAAKITVSLDGGAALTVFDARSRPRSTNATWRPSLRLNSGFFASLTGHAVPLDRRIVEALRDAPLALDAYAWIRRVLQRQVAGTTVTTSWDELLKRFGAASQDGGAFRPAFEAALRQVFDADLSISLAVDDDGVSAEHAAPQANVGAAPEAPPVTTEPEAPPAPQVQAEEAPPAAQPLPPAPPPAAAPAQLDLTMPEAAPPAPEPTRPASAQVVPVQQAPAQPAPASGATQETISLRSHVTGLQQVIWLRRGHGPESPLVGVTPGARFDADRLTVLTVEPMVMQVSGGLSKPDFEQVSAWVMVNRDLIDGFWDGSIASFEEIHGRVRRVPALSARWGMTASL
ncbi:MAG TPA: replication protein RepA [Roseomonas sp.]|jgi:hypothetical protein